MGTVEMSGNISNKYTILYSELGFLARSFGENCMVAYSGFWWTVSVVAFTIKFLSSCLQCGTWIGGNFEIIQTCQLAGVILFAELIWSLS